ncbi:MAG: PrsW family intramembrane metalloprotease [bacterium]|nr:PrsW family intramembrane metalloprotease [bacterium]
MIDGFALLVSLVFSTAFLVVVLAFVWWMDRYDREPIRLVVLVFAWGATISFVGSLVVESLARSALVSAYGEVGASMQLLVVIGPLIEEVAKGIGILLVVLLSKHFDNPTDGIVYGTAVGLGFAVAENALYGFAGFLQGMDNGGIVELTILRTVFSAGIHAVSSAALGGLMGFAYLSPISLKRVLWLLSAVGLATLLHGGWNGAHVYATGELSIFGMLFMVLCLYLSYILTLFLFLRSEHRILHRQLTEEVELGVLPQWVVEIIPFYRKRIRSGWLGSRLEQAVVSRALTRLAFRKHAIERLPASERELAALEVVTIRESARKMLAHAPERPS